MICIADGFEAAASEYLCHLAREQGRHQRRICGTMNDLLLRIDDGTRAACRVLSTKDLDFGHELQVFPLGANCSSRHRHSSSLAGHISNKRLISDLLESSASPIRSNGRGPGQNRTEWGMGLEPPQWSVIALGASFR